MYAYMSTQTSLPLCLMLHSTPVCSISECGCRCFPQAWCRLCLWEHWAVRDRSSPLIWTPDPNSQSALHQTSTERISIYSAFYFLYIDLIYNSSRPPSIHRLWWSLSVVSLIFFFFSSSPDNFLFLLFKFLLGPVLSALRPCLSSFQTRWILEIISKHIQAADRL